MTWYEQLLYDLLPDGTYIRCCRVVRKRPSGFAVAILHMKRAKHKKALVLEHNGYRYRYRHGSQADLHMAEGDAKSLSSGYAFYLPAGKLDYESAMKLLFSYHLKDYIGFDRRLALPGEYEDETVDRLIPKETLNNIKLLLDLMI